MISFPLFPLWSLRHITAQPDPQGSTLLIPVLAQLSRSKGHHLILFTFFKYTQQFCNLTGKRSGKNSDPDTNHVRWHEHAQKSKVIPFPAGYWEPIFMATNCCHVGTANMSEPVITLKNSQPWFSLKSLLQTKKIRVSNPCLRLAHNKNKVKWTSKESANCPSIGKRDRREQSCGICKIDDESKNCSDQFNSLNQPWVKKKESLNLVKWNNLDQRLKMTKQIFF